MKIKTFIATLIIGVTLTNLSQANDINMSWSMRALQGQALTQTIKQAKLLKYTKSDTLRAKQTYITNVQTKRSKQSDKSRSRP